MGNAQAMGLGAPAPWDAPPVRSPIQGLYCRAGPEGRSAGSN